MKVSRVFRSIGRGLARIEPDNGILVSYAARHGQIALDGRGKHSPYTTALLKFMKQPGLELNFFFRKVRDDVLKQTGKRQTPHVYGSLPAQYFYFLPPRAQARQ